MFPIKRTVFFSTVAVHKNTVRLIGNIEYHPIMGPIVTRDSFRGYQNHPQN